jgi:hypothetical protein
MRGLTREPREAVGERRRPIDHALARDAAFVLAWFVGLAVVGAVVWWQVTPLAEYTRTAEAMSMGEEQLARQVSSDAWFFVIGIVGGLLSGVSLLVLRRRDPVATVVLVTIGSLLASWLVLRLGLWLGPPAPQDALREAAVGDKVPLQLKTSTAGVFFSWPIGSLLGAVAVLWSSEEKRGSGSEPPSAANEGWSPPDPR